MRSCLRQGLRAMVLILLGGGIYHVSLFYVWPWVVAANSSEGRATVSAVSTAAAFEAEDVLTVNVGDSGTQQWWKVFWYALQSERPRDRAVFVAHEGGPNIHSLYLLKGDMGHRITIRGLEVQSAQAPLQHLAAR